MHIRIGERTGRTDLAAWRGGAYPLPVTLRNRMTIRLSLPEAGLRLDPLGEQTVSFGSFDVFQRTVSSLEQLATIWRAPELVQLELDAPAAAAPTEEPAAVPVPVPEPEPEPATDPDLDPDPDTAPEPELSTATVEPVSRIIAEAGERLTVAVGDVQFEIQRNQRRADGTLTPRAQRLFEQAKAALEAAS